MIREILYAKKSKSEIIPLFVFIYEIKIDLAPKSMIIKSSISRVTESHMKIPLLVFIFFGK